MEPMVAHTLWPVSMDLLDKKKNKVRVLASVLVELFCASVLWMKLALLLSSSVVQSSFVGPIGPAME